MPVSDVPLTVPDAPYVTLLSPWHPDLSSVLDFCNLDIDMVQNIAQEHPLHGQATGNVTTPSLCFIFLFIYFFLLHFWVLITKFSCKHVMKQAMVQATSKTKLYTFSPSFALCPYYCTIVNLSNLGST